MQVAVFRLHLPPFIFLGRYLSANSLGTIYVWRYSGPMRPIQLSSGRVALPNLGPTTEEGSGFSHAVCGGSPGQTLATAEIGAQIPRVLNLKEAATFVRCSRAHLCNILNGKVRDIPRLPAVRVGRRVLFRRESLEKWLRDVEATQGGRGSY